MRTLLCFCLSSLIVAAAHSVLADTHTWVGPAESGNFLSAQNWTNSLGVAELPAPGDVAYVPGVATIEITDDDAALFSSLKRVWLNKWNADEKRGATIVLNTTTNILVGCAINGQGKLVKRGQADAELASEWTDPSFYVYSRYRTYCLQYGITEVLEGSLTLPQNRKIRYVWNYTPIYIAKGATLVLSKEDDDNCFLYQLTGEGTVESRNEKLTWLQVGRGWVSQPKMAVFSGKLTGKIRLLVYGQQGFDGTESDMSDYFMSYNGSADGTRYGVLGLANLGEAGQPSCVGLIRWVGCFFGGHLQYIGSGETTTREIQLDTRKRNGYDNLPGVVHFDAGRVGGLRLEGPFTWGSWGSNSEDRWLAKFVLTGSNTVPCTIAGPYQLQFTSAIADGSTKEFSYYTVKEGTGTWRFEENAKTTYRGAFDVREGTLQFNSLANKGVLCALGKGDLTTDGVDSKWDAARFCNIAFRFGSANPAAVPVFEYVGDARGCSVDRKAQMNGDVRFKASGTSAAASFEFGDVTAVGTTEKTLTLDGENAGENVLRDFSEETGATTSLVKDGAGSWSLAGRQAFSGDVKVLAGKLTVRKAVPFRYFKIVFPEGYEHPNGSYIKEFALYDAEGRRCNLGVTFQKPENVDWAKTYTPNETAATLSAGKMAFDSLDGKTYSAYTYDAAHNKLDNLCDGTSAHAQFVTGFGINGAKGVISMRLADDCPEIAYMDFCQDVGQYNEPVGSPRFQTASGFVLYGSLDGRAWTKVVERHGLTINKTGTDWYYSASRLTVDSASGDRALGDGEGLALDSRAADYCEEEMLTNARSFQVDAGATFEYLDNTNMTISKLRIDASKGAGTLKGVSFADEVAIDVTNVPRGGGEVAVGLADVGNLTESTKTFTVDGQPSNKFSFVLSGDKLRIIPSGLTVIIR